MLCITNKNSLTVHKYWIGALSFLSTIITPKQKNAI